MTQIIGIIQVKGGAGRSTVATNLAGLIADGGKKVVLVDCDMPQGTSASWGAIRQAEPKASPVSIATAKDHVQLVELVTQLNNNFDFIVIDAPPRIAEITRAVVILSNLCLVPIGASTPEVWATSDLMETIKAAKERKPDLDVRLLWNRFRKSTRLAVELSAAAGKELGLKEMKSKLGYRVAYQESMGRGMTVAEWPDKAAKSELLALGKEIESILKTKFVRVNR